MRHSSKLPIEWLLHTHSFSPKYLIVYCKNCFYNIMMKECSKLSFLVDELSFDCLGLRSVIGGAEDKVCCHDEDIISKSENNNGGHL